MGRGLGLSTGWVLRLLLAKRKVAQISGRHLRRIDDAGVHVIGRGEERVVAGRHHRHLRRPGAGALALRRALIARGRHAHLIGGAERAAELDAMRAIDQGTRLAFAFGEAPGA